MKKLITSFFCLIFCSALFAGQLNPFAYGLKLDTPNDASAVTRLCFSLNATATSVKVVIIDEDGNDYVLRSYSTTDAGNYGTDVFAAELLTIGVPVGQDLKWRVDVTGSEVAAATKVTHDNNSVKEYYFFRPTSVDTDDNPESPNFGRVICTEAYQEIKGKTGSTASGRAYSSYTSYNLGAGIYEFDAKFNFVEGHNGKNTFEIYRKDLAAKKSSAPHRVRIADDGRVFATSFNGGTAWGGKIMWIVDAATLDTWTPAFGYSYINSESSNLVTSNGYYIAAPNIGFDVQGGGSNLRILMLSGAQACYSYTNSAFRCYEYAWGNKTTWSTAPTKKWFDGANGTYKVINYEGSQVQFDGHGGIWVCQYQSTSTATNPSLVYYDKDGNYRFHEVMNNRGGGGFRFNKDFTRVIISGGNGTNGEATVYTVSNDANGYPTKLTKEFTIAMGLGHGMCDYAWDYADNIYAISYSAEKLVAYALPHTADRVISTSAASGYIFSIDCQIGEYYDVNVASANSSQGTVEGGGSHIASCTGVTVFAKSKEGYKFVSWKDDAGNLVSTSNPFTFSVAEDITLTAYFEACSYNVTWWNLFKDGEDIYDAEIDTERNARLYYLFMAYYNAGSGGALRWAAKMADSSGEYNLVNSCYVYADELLNENSSAPMYWLGEYVKSVVGEAHTFYVAGDNDQTANTRWGQALYAMINRVGYAKSPSSPYSKYTTPEGLMNAIKAFAPISSGGEGKGEYTEWRPWWTNLSCELPNSLKYNNALPVTWTMQSAPYNAYDTYENNTVPGNYQPEKTPKWYQWNTAPKNDQLLAWRSGSETGKIVHHITQDNMALYATYVDKVLQENDPDPSGQYDAKNSDVLSLLANDNHGETPHNVTIDRKFAGGMYNTVCFPFDLPVSKLPSELSGADIRVFSGVSETYNESGDPVVVLNFETLTDYWTNRQSYLGEPYMEAGVPYLISPTDDINDASLTYSGLKQNRFLEDIDSVRSATYNDVKFQGVLNPTTITEENAYILVADSRLAKVTGNNKEIKGFRGYFIFDDAYMQSLAAEGRVYLSMRKPATTSIPLAPEAEQPTQPKARKIMRDGQIYILRGEEVYTITGHRVK